MYNLSINIAPIGAVIKIAITAAVKTNEPQDNPSIKAIPPIEACTVALGKYDMIMYAFSLSVYVVAIKEHKTPMDLVIRARK